ncbi:GTPase family protein [Prochlorothrix hollandica]|uniref:GTPase family protein n=1 Tax=Prochlorothrix hollandica TaxID=1223 RepID=UPI00333E2C90
MVENTSNYEGLFETLEKQGIHIPPELKAKIEDQLNNKLNYEPKIGIFGKTGVGKSSLCNAVFGQDVCPISDVEACTRQPQEVFLRIGGKGLKLLDVPGVGESGERDKEYADLYKKLFPELDLILWVLKGDDRAFSSDEQFYKEIVRPYIQAGKPFFMVINQVDKIEPLREWDEKNKRPGGKQAANIDAKHRSVSGYFELPMAQVLTVSANEKYRLVELVDAIIHALPKDKKIVLLKQVAEENVSENAKREAESGWLDTVVEVIRIVADVVTKVGKSLVSWVFSWF